MESRFLLLLLTQVLVLASLTGCGRRELVQGEDGGQPPVIEPEADSPARSQSS